MARSIEFILKSFGLIGVRTLIYRKDEILGLNNGEGLNDRDVDYEGLTGKPFRPQKLSYLGTPVFDPVTLKSLDGSVSIEVDAILTDVSMSKNIVTTSIQGRSGTVKEYIADGDYNIVFRGVVVDGGGDYPHLDVSILRDLVQLPEALICESDYLRLWGINNVVVQSYNFPQREGFINIQLFEIQCLSDQPIELIIENEEAL